MLNTVLGLFDKVLTPVLAIGRNLAWMALVLMVAIIMAQVISRYIVNSPLSWTEEAARFLMLWMTGLIAPTAYRRGGFVSIDMLLTALPKKIGGVIALLFLLMALLVLITGIKLGLNHVKSGWIFNSSSLKIDMSWFGYGLLRLKLAWMYMALLVGVILLTVVNIELVLKAIQRLVTPGAGLEAADPLAVESV